jgi:hypothetical protein
VEEVFLLRSGPMQGCRANDDDDDDVLSLGMRYTNMKINATRIQMFI